MLSSGAPSADEYVPREQLLHVAIDVAPVALLLHLPLGQATHDASPGSDWYSPAAHSEQPEAPACATRPATHVEQVKSSSRPVLAATRYAPVPHVLQPTLPAGATRPAGQDRQDERDELCANVFSPHRSHELCCGLP